MSLGFNPEVHRRRSIRLHGYNYANLGWYFVTIVLKNRDCLFGSIIKNKMTLNEYGQIAHNEWLNTLKIRENVELDMFVIMPNHVHGIIIIVGGSKNVGINDDGMANDNVGAYRHTPLRHG